MQKKNIDGVTTTSATITLPAVAKIANELGLVGINQSVVDTLLNKFKIKNKLYEEGLNNAGSLQISQLHLYLRKLDLLLSIHQ